jgi:pentatricopeptide repeat protein
MLLSLPPVLLLWGIIAFAIGFIAYTAQDLVVGDSDKGQWDAAWIAISISFFILVVVMLSLYNLAGMWKTGREWFRNMFRTGHPPSV